MTQTMTDFGSGYKGPNPELSPDYNEAKDTPRYKQMRASKLGVSEDEMYKWMRYKDKPTSEYVAASASAGTAMHGWFQSEMLKDGRAVDSEVLVEDKQHHVAGHIDVVTPNSLGDIKSVSNGIFKNIAQEGPKPSHKAQVLFYLGATGTERGFIDYVNRDNPQQQKRYHVDFNPNEYENLMRKVERARKRMDNDILAKTIMYATLPRSASAERLREENAKKPSSQIEAGNAQQHRQTFQEEMAYLNSVKRGMPTRGAGAQRIKDKQKEKREGAMVSTQGLALQIWNNRNQHHVR